MSKQNIHFFTEGLSYQIRNKGILRRGIEKLIRDREELPGAINIIFCSDRILSRYNKKYLNKNTLTDVIAFDFSEGKTGISGDLFISLERVRENARKYGVSVRTETVRVLIHGILHLTGMSDDSESARLRMKEVEDASISLFIKN